MTVNERLIAALSPLGLPVLPDTDPGHRERCFTFNYDAQPYHWADDRPHYWRDLIQVHLFLPLVENGLELRGRAVTALVSGGFSWPEVLDLSDDDGQHYVYEVEYLQKMEV